MESQSTLKLAILLFFPQINHISIERQFRTQKPTLFFKKSLNIQIGLTEHVRPVRHHAGLLGVRSSNGCL